MKIREINNKCRLDVETNVVSGKTLNKLLVVHFNRLDFSGHVRRSEGNDHASFDDTSLDTTNGHSANTTDLVDILEGKTEGLVRRTDRRFDGIDSIEEGLALDNTTLGLLGPTLVPWHAVRRENVIKSEIQMKLTWGTPPTCCHRASQRWGRMQQP